LPIPDPVIETGFRGQHLKVLKPVGLPKRLLSTTIDPPANDEAVIYTTAQAVQPYRQLFGVRSLIPELEQWLVVCHTVAESVRDLQMQSKLMPVLLIAPLVGILDWVVRENQRDNICGINGRQGSEEIGPEPKSQSSYDIFSCRLRISFDRCLFVIQDPINRGLCFLGEWVVMRLLIVIPRISMVVCSSRRGIPLRHNTVHRIPEVHLDTPQQGENHGRNRIVPSVGTTHLLIGRELKKAPVPGDPGRGQEVDEVV